MTALIKTPPIKFDINLDISRFLRITGIIIVGIISICILQDFLEAKRSQYSFNFSESLLFKSVWVLFLPILAVLYFMINRYKIWNWKKMLQAVLLAMLSHLFMLPILSYVFSTLFFNNQYDIYKFLSYSLSHDLFKLLVVYVGFVSGFSYLNYSKNEAIHLEEVQLQNEIEVEFLLIKNGKSIEKVCIREIILIEASKPYISIQTAEKNFLYAETLKSIYHQLDKETFVQIHRSRIVNIESVKAYHSRLNGDYDVLLKSGEKIRLSRTFVEGFKKCLNSSTRSGV
ncbi:LytR/AlgR family response regulator transcription factor [Sphingobacterium endophyticum]|uniref:LytR/AlgR family response regulator transcription factor n=1 Tax=Sphingobacterium endophyticum TaxID=2546448 RepID=UPI0012E2AD8B|nr:LytTR family DNA-binding domain-containing protein [Sphingobacterium endophyticum]